MKSETTTSPAWRAVWLDLAIAAVLLAMALVVRLYMLRDFPPGLYNDEAAYANDAVGVLQGRHAVFFERNSGREPLYIYLLAAVFKLFGVTTYAVRATSAVLGALTVPVSYWLAAASTRYERPTQPRAAHWVGLWVGLFMAFSYWHISFSRLGFRAITLPLVLALAFVFVWRMWRRLRDEPRLPWSDLLLAGAMLGLTFYTYISGRMGIVIFAASALWAFVRAPAFGMSRRRVVWASIVVVVVTLIVVAPLAAYFLANPNSFASRSAFVSIFSPQFAPEGPVRAFLSGALKTALMFFNLPDGNLRHNPAQLPVVDPVLGIWILGGAMLAVAQWRKFTPPVYLAWIAFMVAPALLSAERMPHSLRTIGLMPAVFVLAVLAMGWVVERLGRGARLSVVAALLPLPFLLYSGYISVQGYFAATSNPDRYRSSFMVDELRMAELIGERGGDEFWLITLSPNFQLYDTDSNTITFGIAGRAKYATILVREDAATARLDQVLPGSSRINVLRLTDSPALAESSIVYVDAKNLLDFLLRRNGRLVEQRDGAELGGIPYSVYDLKAERDFAVPAAQPITPVTFAEAIRLTGATVGSVGDMAGSAAGNAISLAGDNSLWAVFRWEPLRPIDIDLKTSLTLVNADGRLAGQVDGLLVGDRYPVERVWATGEPSNSYTILSPLPAVPPGEYALRLSVYEDVSGRIYPAAEEGAMPGPTVDLGTVRILPPAAPVVVEPPPATVALEWDGVRLAGYDALPATVAPGERLPLTLYWQAARRPSVDLTARLELRNEAGESVQRAEAAPGGEGWPTSAWREGENVRQWSAVTVGADLPSGEYALVASIVEGDTVRASAQLGSVRVEGRSRLFDVPSLDVEATATYGADVRLLGARTEVPVRLEPGDPLNLTLVWQPLQTAQQSLVRFAQLLNAQGVLVAQQDTIPCAQACPSTSWLADEVLLDEVTMELPADLPEGSYRVVVGWYDAATQQRLSASDDAGAAVADGAFALPLELVR